MCDFFGIRPAGGLLEPRFRALDVQQKMFQKQPLPNMFHFACVTMYVPMRHVRVFILLSEPVVHIHLGSGLFGVFGLLGGDE